MRFRVYIRGIEWSTRTSAQSKLSRRVLPDIANHRLDTIADHFSIPIVSRHRAGSDALATAEIFLFLLTMLEEDHGVKDLSTARSFSVSGTQTIRDAKSGSRQPSVSFRSLGFVRRRLHLA
jgi:DNA polymerase III epsilon subunit-like protein